MKHAILRKSVRQKLTGQGIDALSLQIQEILSAIGYDRRKITGVRLSAEEVLLNWQERFGQEAECVLTVGRYLRKPFINLSLRGERFDATDDEAQSDYGQRLLSRLGLRPSYAYARGVNTVTFKLSPPSVNPLISIIAAVIMAVLFGALGRWLSPEVREFITVEGLRRIQDLFFGLLNMVALPLIFFSLITGICGIGDTAALSGVGTRLAGRYYFTTLTMVALSGIICVLLFRVNVTTAANFASGTSEILDMLFGMIPTNVVDAFYSGSFTQIMILAVAIGAAMLVMGKQCSDVIRGVEQLQGVFNQLMCWVCKLLPLGIFVILLDNIWANTIQELLQIWKPLVIAGGIMVLYLVMDLIILGLGTKASPWMLWKKVLPVFLMAFASASSIAAYGEAVQCSKERLGIDKKLVDFGLPLMLAICSVGSTVAFMVVTMCSVAVHSVPITVGGLAVACVLCTLLVMSSPSTAGGPVSCFAIMFAHLGIPESALGITILAYLLLDFPATGVNITSKLLVLLTQSLKEDAVDLDQLRRT